MQFKKITEKHIEIKEDEFTIKPDFNKEELVLKRRAVYNSLRKIFDEKVRIDTKSITSILDATEKTNYTDNIQQNYSVHSNKNGVVVQPMRKYRMKRNRL